MYEALDERDERHVALKILDAAHAGIEEVALRMERESRVASTIRSEHVVRVFDFGRHEDRPYLVMELLHGRDLGDVLEEHDKLDAVRGASLLLGVLHGLAAVHAAGAVHRDLKPENVFIVDEGKPTENVKLVDFGMSKPARPKADEDLTARGTIIGTPMYIAPEQARAAPDVDARADVYAAGAILFECLCGRPPHVASTEERVILAIATTEAPDIRKYAPALPTALAEVVNKALARTREERFPSALAFAEALARAVPEARVPNAAPLAPAARAASAREAPAAVDGRALLLIGLGVILLVVAFIFWVARPH